MKKIDDYTKINHKSYSSKKSELDSKKIKYLKNLITRSLLSIIFIISICILIKVNDNNKVMVNKYLYEDSLSFTKINNWYQDKFGKLLPKVENSDELVLNSDDFKSYKYEKYKDGVKIDIKKGSPISLLNGGIVVFIGEKEGYGNTLILQGNDGIDYWYGNITNTNATLYDYLEKDTLIGEAKDNYIYLVLQKDGQYLSYEEYLK